MGLNFCKNAINTLLMFYVFSILPWKNLLLKNLKKIKQINKNKKNGEMERNNTSNQRNALWGSQAGKPPLQLCNGD